MKIAIVILNWNGIVHLTRYLPSVIEHTDLNLCDIYVADNGSNDGSVEFLQKNYPQVKLILLDQNYGFAGGYNRALKQIDADIYCMLNSDVRVTPGWVDPILRVFQREADVSAIQPKILSDQDWSHFEHAGAAGGFMDQYAYPFCRGRIMDAIEYDRGQYNKKTDIFWASGACLFIRSKVFHEVGGFDDDYFAHMEEIDLCWRMKNQGHRILFVYKSKVHHFGGATLEYNNPRKLFLNFRNSLWTLYKNYTGSFLGWIMFRRMSIDTMAILKYALTFDFKNAGAIIRAHFAYYGSKTALRAKRKELKKKVKVRRHLEVYPGSIVFQYFLRSRKTFTDLEKLHHAVIMEAKRRKY